MDYKIKQFDQSTGQIVVEFLLIDGVEIAIDLPIDENRCVPTGDALDTYIKGFLPYGAVQRKQALAGGIANASELMALFEPPSPPVDENLAGLE